jgi:hypothetical protein
MLASKKMPGKNAGMRALFLTLRRRSEEVSDHDEDIEYAGGHSEYPAI